MAKYDPEISGPGNVMINGTSAMKFKDAIEYANSILDAVKEGYFLEKNGMSKEEFELRESIGEWDKALYVGPELAKEFEKARWKASFSHGHQE